LASQGSGRDRAASRAQCPWNGDETFTASGGKSGNALAQHRHGILSKHHFKHGYPFRSANQLDLSVSMEFPETPTSTLLEQNKQSQANSTLNSTLNTFIGKIHSPPTPKFESPCANSNSTPQHDSNLSFFGKTALYTTTTH